MERERERQQSCHRMVGSEDETRRCKLSARAGTWLDDIGEKDGGDTMTFL